MMKTEQKPTLKLKLDAAGRGYFVARGWHRSFYNQAYDWSTAREVPRVIVWHDPKTSFVEWDCCTAEGQRHLVKGIMAYSDSFMDELKELLFDLGVEEFIGIGSSYVGVVQNLTPTQAEYLAEQITAMLSGLLKCVQEQLAEEAPV